MDWKIINDQECFKSVGIRLNVDYIYQIHLIRTLIYADDIIWSRWR